MSTELQPDQKSQKKLYETDFVRWVETTVEQLQSQNYRDVDWDHLVEGNTLDIQYSRYSYLLCSARGQYIGTSC